MFGFLADKLNLLKAKLVKIHKSITIWFNGISGSLVIILPFLQDQMPQLNDYLSENFFRYAMGIIVLGNIILRFKTAKALEHK